MMNNKKHQHPPPSQLSDVDELLLRSDIILQRSQREDGTSSQEQYPYQSQSQAQFSASNQSHNGGGLYDIPMRSDITSGDDNHLVIREEEDEDRFQSATIQTEDDGIAGMGSGATGTQSAQMMDTLGQQRQLTLEDELRSISQGMMVQTPSETRHERISKEIDQVKSSLKHQLEIESQLEQRLSAEKQLFTGSKNGTNSIKNTETVDEPEILLTMSNQNPSQSASKSKPFMSSEYLRWTNTNNQNSSSKHLSSSANRDINHVRSEHSSIVHPQKRVRRGTNSRKNSAVARFKKNGTQKIVHKTGCPAHLSTGSHLKVLRSGGSRGTVTTSQRLISNTVSSPKDDQTLLSRRSRMERSLHSLKRSQDTKKS